MVPEEGLEPSCLAAHDFESCVYPNFTTPANFLEQLNSTGSKVRCQNVVADGILRPNSMGEDEHQSIDRRPLWLSKRSRQVARVAVGEAEVPYTVVDANLAEDLESRLPGIVHLLPDFVGRTPDGDFFISAPVLEKDQLLWVRHEVREYTEYAEQEGRCLRALQEELAEVPKEELPDYIARRRNFFRRLVKFHQYSPDRMFKNELARSLVYLESL